MLDLRRFCKILYACFINKSNNRHRNNLFPQHIKENMDKCTVIEYVMKTKNR